MKGDQTFGVGPDDLGRRLDRVVRRLLPGAPLALLFAAIRTGRIRVGGRRVDGAYRIAQGDTITVPGTEFGGAFRASAERSVSPRRQGGLDPATILFESADLLAVNKPRGSLMHQGGAGSDGALDAAVRRYLEGRLPPSLSFRPGPLHRLDRNTSGLVLFGKSAHGARLFTELTLAGRIAKSYLALLDGSVEAGEWIDWLARDGERRVTHTIAPGDDTEKGLARSIVQPLGTFDGMCLCLVQLRGGKTHQIRAQAQAHGSPLRGDAKYGGSPWSGGFFLHAFRIDVEAPRETLGFSSLQAPLPADRTTLLATSLDLGGLLRQAGEFAGLLARHGRRQRD